MILQETVFIKLNGRNVKQFESLGYDIPKRQTKYNGERIILNSIIEINIKHIFKNSHVKILCKCDICGQENLVVYQNIKHPPNYICKKCSMNQEETISKIKKARKNQIFSDEAKMKMSNNHWCKGKFGKNNPFYRHDLSDEERYLTYNRRYYPNYNSWQKEVLKRDNRTCQKCGSKDKPCAHHINNWIDFKEQRTDIENGIVLCKKCHELFHSIFGNKHTNKNQYKVFILEY